MMEIIVEGLATATPQRAPAGREVLELLDLSVERAGHIPVLVISGLEVQDPPAREQVQHR
jgi:hypothetical protein